MNAVGGVIYIMKYLLSMIMLAMTTLTTNAQGMHNKAAKQNSLPLVNEWAMIKYILTLVWALTMTSAYAQTSDIMKKNILTQRQLSLAECASLEAQGDMVRLDVALSKALDNGVSVNELKEAFSQLYAYTGLTFNITH